MSLQPDVDAATSLPRATSAESESEVPNSVFRRSSTGSRRGSDSSRSPFSGLSALIQAATSQLGQVSEEAPGGSDYNDENAGARTRHNNNNSKLTTPRRYTPHGFHTSSSMMTNNQLYLDQSNIRGSSSLNTTPTLAPEPGSAAALRKQSFPEILMTVLEDNANADVITFLPDGKFFAVRRKEFTETTMLTYFSVRCFDEFLKKIHSWGFSRIDKGSCRGNRTYKCPGIEIFRHPMFAKGDWDKCSRICFGESPTEVRLSALPDRARIEYTLSDESTITASKRRLSPSHVRKESESSTATSKQRLSIEDDGSSTSMSPLIKAANSVSQIPTAVSKSDSADTESSADASAAAMTEMEDNVRSLALAITTDKLNLKAGVEDEVEASTPLVERAVENATHTIVTDAIETLLRDESHTRETFLKHERELSRSSLPGVVPISKQLFSPPVDAAAVTAAAVAAAEAAGLDCGIGKGGGHQGMIKGIRDPPVGASAVARSTEGTTTRRRRSPDPPASVLTSASVPVGVALSTTSS
ncbi:expressed unknown protein [Seminavis robusta]|uniref:HSF-type DNA-binding domain-containing protein n=1 Tax=Seminavis robusta TaxID=568900 RepID=A0A9N8H8P3_9STRA|nr:expressed unknown protein [Seminavis robusta]|eukprot:Sro166_g074030.1 n/a (528) ;mRNA; f:7436-9019